MGEEKDESQKTIPSARDDASLQELAQFKKSNVLIASKGHLTLLSEKIFAVGAMNIQQGSRGELFAEIKGSKLKKLLGTKSNSFYEQLVEVTEPGAGRKGLLDMRIIYTDDVEEVIQANNIIVSLEYASGVLRIVFNPKLRDYLWEVRGNFTLLDSKFLLRTKSIYSFRMYELLKKEIDFQKNVQHKTEPYTKVYNLTELKLLLGVIDPQSDPRIRKELKKFNPDYDKIDEWATENDNTNDGLWYNFKRYALDRAKKDLATAGIDMSYKTNRAGRGGRVYEVVFEVSEIKPADAKGPETKVLAPEITEEMVFDKIASLQNACDKDAFSLFEFKTLLEAAGYDVQKVIEKYEMLKRAKNVTSRMGWMLSAIKKDYKEEPAKARRRKKSSGRAAANNEVESEPADGEDIDAGLFQ